MKYVVKNRGQIGEYTEIIPETPEELQKLREAYPHLGQFYSVCELNPCETVDGRRERIQRERRYREIGDWLKSIPVDATVTKA